MSKAASVVRYIGTERLCPTTATFSFARPEGYAFRAGEFFRLTIPTPEGPQVHSFSHADAPDDDSVLMLTRLSGSVYKDAMLALQPGDEVMLEGPFGLLVAGPDVRRAVFLVGGVGVSPARGIVRDIVLADRAIEVLMFDGNVDEACIPFEAEFAAYAERREDVRFVHVLMNPSDAWTGERGFITADLVRRHCDSVEDRDWFVCGPPAMVEAMRVVIDELGVPSERRHFELFAGAY